MFRKDTLKWSVTGFVLTSLVLLAVAMLARPTIG